MNGRTGPTALIMALAACSILLGCSQPMQSDTLTSAQTTASITPAPSDTVPIKTMVFVAPLIGPSIASSQAIIRELDLAATRAQIALMVDATVPADYTLRGYLLAAAANGGVEVSYVWDVFDRNGIRIGRHAGSETIPGATAPDAADIWTAFGPAHLQRIAGGAMSAIAAASTQPQFGKTATLPAAVR